MPTPTPSTDPAQLQQQAAANWEEAKRTGPTLLANLRAKYPGAYDDLDDVTLAQKISQKYPDYAADLADVVQPAAQPAKTADPITNVDPLQLTRIPAVREALGNVAEGGKKAFQAIPATAALAGKAALGAGEAALAPFGLTQPTRARQAIEAVRQDPGMIGRAAESMVPPTVRYLANAVGGDPSETTPPTAKQVEEDVGTMGASALIGKAVPELALRVGRRIPMSLPGASVELHSLAAQKIENLAENLRPSAAARTAAWNRLEAAIGPIKYDMGNFRRTLSDLLSEEYQKPLAEQDGAVIGYLKEHLDNSKEGWDFNTIKPGAESIGARIGNFHSTDAGATARATTGAMARRYDKQLGRMLSSINDDVEAGIPSVVVQPAIAPAPMTSYFGGPMHNPQTMEPLMTEGSPAIMGTAPPTAESLAVHPLWKAANKLHRRDMAATGFARDVQDAIGVAGDGWTSVGGLNRLINKVTKAQSLAKLGQKSERLWVNSFEPGEVNDIVSTLRDLRRQVPALTKGRGVITGSSQRLPRAVAGAAAGEVFGGPTAREIGAGIGLAVPELIAQAMMSKPGRALVRVATQMDPTIGPIFQNTVAAFLRSQVNPELDPSLAPTAPAQQPQPAPAPTTIPTATATPVSRETPLNVVQAPLSDIVKGATKLDFGSLVDTYRKADEPDKAQLKAIMHTRLMRGLLSPQEKEQLVKELRPQGQPEVAPMR